jgi:epoxyqueuosine reductase QueG
VAAGTGRWVAGCDLCQSVCPWNEPLTPGPAFTTTNAAYHAELGALARWTPADYRAQVGKQVAMGRVKYGAFLRNVAVAVGNSGLSSADKSAALAALEASARALSEGETRAAALRAIERAKILPG